MHDDAGRGCNCVFFCFPLSPHLRCGDALFAFLVFRPIAVYYTHRARPSYCTVLYFTVYSGMYSSTVLVQYTLYFATLPTHYTTPIGRFAAAAAPSLLLCSLRSLPNKPLHFTYEERSYTSRSTLDMFSLRPATRVLARVPATSRRTMVIPIKKALIKAGETEEPEDVPALEKRMQEMAEEDPLMVFGSGENLPDPVLPDNPAEVTALDPAHLVSTRMPDGRQRMVVIKQMRARPNQSPLNPEKIWKISFNDDGAVGDRWKNSLMGWNSTADTMGCDPPLFFRDAQEAVYFAKKRGWKYLVKEPLIRTLRDDDAQYQDNFLPQAVANQVKREGQQCDHWHRTEAGCSHYFRPLKYHGDGTVRQHGAEPYGETVTHTTPYYKVR